MPSQSASGEADHGVPVACASCNLDFQSALVTWATKRLAPSVPSPWLAEPRKLLPLQIN